MGDSQIDRLALVAMFVVLAVPTGIRKDRTSTVTYIIDGMFLHQDSHGGGGSIISCDAPYNNVINTAQRSG